ncbi:MULTISPECIES: hypothetical protein [unclassified Streptomyces]|uniref:hypothetical protein n=1 Tax=unclassified Streptomyces TaxID=2593676 RepID=UPI0033943A0B
MRITAPATTVIAAGLTIGAHLLIAHHLPHRAATTAQLDAARTDGYRLALSHVSQGRFTTAPEEP